MFLPSFCFLLFREELMESRARCLACSQRVGGRRGAPADGGEKDVEPKGVGGRLAVWEGKWGEEMERTAIPLRVENGVLLWDVVGWLASRNTRLVGVACRRETGRMCTSGSSGGHTWCGCVVGCGARGARSWYWRGTGACQAPRCSDRGARRGGEEQENYACELGVVEGRRVSGGDVSGALGKWRRGVELCGVRARYGARGMWGTEVQ
jgi:hypothetical protein